MPARVNTPGMGLVCIPYRKNFEHSIPLVSRSSPTASITETICAAPSKQPTTFRIMPCLSLACILSVFSVDRSSSWTETTPVLAKRTLLQRRAAACRLVVMRAPRAHHASIESAALSSQTDGREARVHCCHYIGGYCRIYASIVVYDCCKARQPNIGRLQSCLATVYIYIYNICLNCSSLVDVEHT